MSGTSYGACVLHVTPEAYIGGPLAFVQDGDLIELDVPARKLNVLITDAEMAKRKATGVAPAPKFERGFGKIYLQHIQQAHEGCDFDFLETRLDTSHALSQQKSSGGSEPEIH
ncbi:MAG: dihydroxy-acid dehydratase, partial [Polynucleobacter sp.]|nr:dihydroxy-acid dehydratase [Polynucleobacter sp.]